MQNILEINIRALEIKNNSVYSATSNGTVLYFDLDKSDIISEASYTIENDSIIPNFRSLAVTENDVFTISISNPALLFKNGKLVYKEEHPKVFYDSMEFWNNKEGIVVGDFTDNCISILVTRDGGDSWKKLDCSVFGDIKDSEGFFAASDTNISPLLMIILGLQVEELTAEFIFQKTRVRAGKFLILLFYKENLQLVYLVSIFMTRRMVMLLGETILSLK